MRPFADLSRPPTGLRPAAKNRNFFDRGVSVPAFLCQWFLLLWFSVTMHCFMALMAKAYKVSFLHSMPLVPYVQSHLWMSFHVVYMVYCRGCCVSVMLSASLAFIVIHLQHLLPDLLPPGPRIKPVYIVRYAPAHELCFLLRHIPPNSKEGLHIASPLSRGTIIRGFPEYHVINISLILSFEYRITDIPLSCLCYCFSAVPGTSVLLSGSSPYSFCTFLLPQCSFYRTYVCTLPACS